MTPKLPGYKINEKIYQGTRTLVYRGVRHCDSQKVIIKFLRNEYPSFSELVQFRNQYAIAKNVNSTGIVVPLSLERYGNGYALVMPDLGAISLDKAIEKDGFLELGSCLNIAIQLADILHELDRHRVIHKDIKPANILICPKTKQVKLIDFSIASLLPREALEIKNFNILEGTLAYISPEQTGRMNRGIDYRSDFYSLGATLYELLTGVLPFTSSDPVELVHCHISQQPIPPADVKHNSSNLEIPPVVSVIVMKLMAKNAEDRYQSALGLKFDLERCLKQWQETGKIETFELATRDITGRFLIPEKLYGREEEVQALLAAFNRVANPPQPPLNKGGQGKANPPQSRGSGRESGRAEMMLVAGFSGIGKTAVINEVHKPIVRQRGYFIKGKFDQFNRNIPFSAFVQAFRDLMDRLLAESDAKLAQWHDKILAALGENGQIIIDVIPELELLIGKQQTVPELSGTAAQNRFNLLFKKFVKVFTTPEHPLVIFVDDLQWADSASLKLMQLLASESETGYLLLLGAYRDREVYPAHPLMLTLDEIGKSGANVNTIVLAPLSEADLNGLVAQTLSCTQEQARPLTKLIYQKTKGNPFFATQFLKGLHEDGLIVFDRDRGYWLCDMSVVRQLALTSDVVEFMASRLHKLPVATQEVLKLAACIGDRFDLETLVIVSEREQIEVATDLWKALQEGLVLPVSETYKFFQNPPKSPLSRGTKREEEGRAEEISVGYKFLHDRVQQAAYSLIQEKQREITHLQIGRSLLRSVPEKERTKRIFNIVNQFNIGRILINAIEEKQQVARLNLAAGQKAKASTAYRAALEYSATGLEFLEETSWNDCYDLTLKLHALAVEAAYQSSHFEKMQLYAEPIKQNAKTLLDKLLAYEINITANIVQDRPLEAIQIARGILSQFNIEIPEKPSFSDIQEGLEQTMEALKDKTIAELVHLPVMTNLEKIAALKILMRVIPATFQSAPMMVPLITFAMVRLSVQYGNISVSAYGYSLYGLLLCGTFNDIDTGCEFGKLALSVLSKFSDRELKAKILTVVNAHIFHWKQHIKETLEQAIEGYAIGLETGDLEYAGYCAYIYPVHSFWLGRELSYLEKTLGMYCQALRRIKQQVALKWNCIYQQTILNLQGKSTECCDLIGWVYDEREMLPVHQKANDLYTINHLFINKTFLCYLFDRPDRALVCIKRAEESLAGVTGLIVVALFYFYDSLVRLALYPTMQPSEQKEILEKVEANQEKISGWCDRASMNYLHKFNLVAAEKCRVLGEKLEAIDFYDRVIAGAKEHEYLQEEALANELFAKFYLEWGREKEASIYMIDAYYCYARWGAKAKTDQLEEKYPQLLAPILEKPHLPLMSGQTIASTLTRTAGWSSSTTGFMLDWATAMKASQSLSSEIHLDKLVSALMKAAMENAGADGGILLLQQPSGWQVVARSSKEGCDLPLTEVSDEREIPTRVINKVKRSIEAIIVNDFARDTQFARDPYLQQGQPKSFMCAPILNQGKLIGILYLENHLATGAFTTERVELLNMLCSQAAISLENARLYEQSQDYAEKLEQSLADLQLAQLQLVQSEKMSALGNLVAGVAHEINNPVGFIASNLEPARDYLSDLFGLIDLYQQEYPHPSEAIEAEIEAIDLEFLRSDLPQLIGSMQEGTDRIRHISTSLRTFSRTDKEHKVPFDIHQGIESTLLILKHRLKANEEHPAIAIVKEYGDLRKVYCFPGQLNQVFMNLIANAIDAFEDANQGKTYEEIQVNPNCITIRTSALDDDRVQIQIQDNGCGITPETKERIFEQGFTTKAVGKGTGLGMAIARQIIAEKHGGTMECESALGRGTTFTITLPQ